MARALRAARWAVRLVVGMALLLLLAAAGLWWWSGQEGSLDWLLRRVAHGGALQAEGVQGSVRGSWHIARITWERDGLKLVAEDIQLAWEPVALIERTLQVQSLQVARARVIDQRPARKEPFQLPSSLILPWRVKVDALEVGTFS